MTGKLLVPLRTGMKCISESNISSDLEKIMNKNALGVTKSPFEKY